MLDKIYAKSGDLRETLKEHTTAVLQSLNVIRERTEGFDDSFWEGCFYMCLFHDAGKISKNFQRVLQGKYQENIRHELLSGNFLIFLSQNFNNQWALHTLAVFTHHKLLNDELFSDDTAKVLDLDIAVLKEWFEYAASVAVQNNYQTFELTGDKLNTIGGLTSEQYRQCFLHRFYDELKKDSSSTYRRQYIYSKGILTIADWSASGHFKLADELGYSLADLKFMITEKLKKEEKELPAKGIKLKKFQNESLLPENVLAIAPTGSGKTEASLVWASQKDKYDKIIYCLPTRVTSNAIYKRLIQYFGKGNCAVVHSSAILVRKEIDRDYDGRKYLKDRTFFQNISVCTIDQILTQGFNLGFWEVKTFFCRNAWIVIDEIHLFEPYTLALILRTIKYLREEFNAHFYIMSATMPEKLQDLLKGALGGNFQLVQDNELLQNSRNAFETRKSAIQDNLDEIQKALGKHDKVLIVVNTVDQAISLYKKLKAKNSSRNIVCYHSRFTQIDRINIENSIHNAEAKKEPIVLVATQVVEVSLDIDFNIMFTENAPIDALIQRAGRVNRKGEKPNTKIIVHQHSEVSEHVYPELDILKNTYQLLDTISGQRPTEKQFLELVDQVYKDFDVTQKSSFKDGMKAYDIVQENLKYLGDKNPYDEDAVTRQIDAVSVIPWSMYEEMQKLEKLERAKHEISIRVWRYRQANRPSDSEGFNYVDYPYDKKVGLQFSDNDEETDTFTSYTY